MKCPYDGIHNLIEDYNAYIRYLENKLKELQEENTELKKENFRLKNGEVFVKNKKL